VVCGGPRRDRYHVTPHRRSSPIASVMTDGPFRDNRVGVHVMSYHVPQTFTYHIDIDIDSLLDPAASYPCGFPGNSHNLIQPISTRSYNRVVLPHTANPSVPIERPLTPLISHPRTADHKPTSLSRNAVKTPPKSGLLSERMS